MKVAIITIYDLLNYGNRLQNYAVVKVAEKVGYTVDTLIIDEIFPKDCIKLIMGKKRTYHWNVRQEMDDYYEGLSLAKRKKFDKFSVFTKKHMSIKTIKGFHSKLKALNKEYDMFIAGGDQIWNPFIGHAYSWEFLDFADRNKKMSFSPSFGVEVIPNEEKKRISKLLNDFQYLSVRENAGRMIIQGLVGKNAEVMIDPTLMLSREEWDSIAELPEIEIVDVPYILTYFLGNVDSRADKLIEELQESKGYNVIRLNDESDPFFTSDPGEFIGLFRNAELILTDSFHACVFSFIYEKPFIVFSRNGKENNMMSRINTFLGKFYLERKYFDSGLTNDIWEHDYSAGYKQLIAEQEVVNKFIFEALCKKKK